MVSKTSEKCLLVKQDLHRLTLIRSKVTGRINVAEAGYSNPTTSNLSGRVDGRRTSTWAKEGKPREGKKWIF